ncbi:MAG: hypothetical protein ACREQP_20775 [Candidatus Binatia bacterium]
MERLKMGFSMRAAARALARSSTLAGNPSASSAALRKSLFLRFYGQDFDAATCKKILQALERHNRKP